MHITVKEELRVYIDPLTPEEHDALERSILAEGCRDALVLWGDVLVDGHNRYGICQKHGIPFQTMQHPAFKSMDDVHLWMIDQHLGRRSVSDFQRGVLALRKKDILLARQQTRLDGAREPVSAAGGEPGQVPGAEPAQPEGASPDQAAAIKPAEPLNSREAIAKAARISSTTVSQIEKIQKAAAPELVAAVKAGEISINAAAAVASLPVAEQVAAVAGGKKELQQAARQVREAKAQARAVAVGEMLDQPAHEGAAAEATDAATQALIQRLNQTIASLTAENTRLKARLAELGEPASELATAGGAHWA
jgi:hypothetical protein